MAERILIVDDEPDILELVRYNLDQAGYKTSCVTSGEEALKVTRSAPPDLIVLDLMLPGIDGLDVCRILKADDEAKTIPILMLSARGEESDIIKGLELGAEDYITKPFSPRVLVARVKAVSRRVKEGAIGKADLISIHNLTIHPGRREVRVGSQPVELTYSEFQILHLLARHPGWAFTRHQIIDSIHGEDYPVTERSVDFQIVGLRKKLGSAGQYIRTVRGVGYRFLVREE